MSHSRPLSIRINSHPIYVTFHFIVIYPGPSHKHCAPSAFRARVFKFQELPPFYQLASSLEYPQRIEWSQSLNRLRILCSLLDCQQIFSFFPLSSFSFYTVQYRRVQYSTVIGQLPRVSTEDRVVSVFEFRVCLFFVSKFSYFFLFNPSLFIQYSTEVCSTVQLFIYNQTFQQLSYS